MLKIEMVLLDENEVEVFHKLVSVVRKYREAKYAEEQKQWAGEPAMADEVVDAPEHPAPEQVVAHISPEGAVKPIPVEKVQEAAQKFAQVHGLDKALAVVKEFGASRVSEIKDPVKLALLFERLTK